jgi:MFS transporter, BCD family, chlorophyll transporter
MSPFSRRLMRSWAELGPRFLPFADAASANLPLSRLLRLSLFQVSVGMALALLVGALNRVLIVELGVSAGLVALMVALPVLYAPARAMIGFKSDHHRSALGWRRVPFIWMGSMLQFGGLAVMPFALLVLAGQGESTHWPSWLGPAGAATAFLLMGAGVHTVQTAGLALATDLAPAEDRPKVVGLMFVMLLVGTIVSAFAFGAVLAEFSPGRLVQVIQACAVVTLVLNTIALWKQESIGRSRLHRKGSDPEPEPDFREAWAGYAALDGTRRRLVAIGLGTMGFAMQDVLLEPYGGEVLGMSVGQTTWLTAAFATGGLAGFTLASRLLTRGWPQALGGAGRALDPAAMAMLGALLGVPAFGAVLVAALSQSVPLFVAGVMLIGFGGGLFGHGTLTLTMNRAPREHAGLALGAWGAAQATAAGIAVAAGGLLRDAVQAWGPGLFGPVPWPAAASGYAFVYAIEIVLLIATVWVMRPLVGVGTQTLGGAAFARGTPSSNPS